MPIVLEVDAETEREKRCSAVACADLIADTPSALVLPLIVVEDLVNVGTVSLQGVADGNVDTHLATPVETVADRWRKIDSTSTDKVVA